MKLPLYISVEDYAEVSGMKYLTVTNLRSDDHRYIAWISNLARLKLIELLNKWYLFEVREYSLGEKYLGVWNQRNCPKNFEFDETKQRCIEHKKLRRQQAACSINPTSVGCQPGCQSYLLSNFDLNFYFYLISAVKWF